MVCGLRCAVLTLDLTSYHQCSVLMYLVDFDCCCPRPSLPPLDSSRPWHVVLMHPLYNGCVPLHCLRTASCTQEDGALSSMHCSWSCGAPLVPRAASQGQAHCWTRWWCLCRAAAVQSLRAMRRGGRRSMVQLGECVQSVHTHGVHAPRCWRCWAGCLLVVRAMWATLPVLPRSRLNAKPQRLQQQPHVQRQSVSAADTALRVLQQHGWRPQQQLTAQQQRRLRGLPLLRRRMKPSLCGEQLQTQALQQTQRYVQQQRQLRLQLQPLLWPQLHLLLQRVRRSHESEPAGRGPELVQRRRLQLHALHDWLPSPLHWHQRWHETRCAPLR